MIGKVVRSFVAIMQDGVFRGVEGEEIEIVDHGWITAGLVIPIRGPSERAVIKPVEKAIKEGNRGS